MVPSLAGMAVKDELSGLGPRGDLASGWPPTFALDRWWPLEELLAVAVRPWRVMMVG